MDTALTLRIAAETGDHIDDAKISSLLNESKLVRRLTDDFVEHPLFAVFRIMGLSEVPSAERLPYTKKIVDYIDRSIATSEGFSCLGGVKELVPCYNAMLLEAYCHLGRADTEEAQAALKWIKRYQLFERGKTTSWPYEGICKHGGCLGKTPCYIGIGKTVRALVTYSERLKHSDHEVESLLSEGISYMLRHDMYQRLSNGKPISAHITDIMLPQNYALSLTDLAYIVGKRHLAAEENCTPLLRLIREKQVAENQWRIDYSYRYKGYVSFESKGTTSAWISTLFPLWLNDPQ